MANPEDQFLAVLTWMGWHIHQLNQHLSSILADLMTCLPAQAHPDVAIFAAPIAPRVGVDGFCNLHRQPIALVIDPSRVIPADWPHLVAHELAHAIAGTTGHGAEFHSALSHLCLAQDLPMPPTARAARDWLRYWPPCRPNPQVDQFWLGHGACYGPNP
ncbi:MAG TPA: hypothetical protein IGR64_15215 [Leptolyngbyaceae cyanobacterium M65_K2018_010]|nr:hypothetical protein [Leptolyngbyaceae cyanobacterium M65_K2018_010]